MNEVNELKGQIALVSGAGRGIGAALAKALAAAGADTVCAARSEAQVTAVVAEIATTGGAAEAVVCDISDPASLGQMFDHIEATKGGLDLVLINAGTSGERATIEQSDPDAWRAVMNVNLIGAYDQARLAIPLLKIRGGGKIVMMGSGIGRRPTAGGSAYAVSKAGLAMLTRVLAMELREHNIAVNEIVPGPVRTTLTGVPAESAASEAELEGIRRRFPTSEWIKNPEDVVPVMMYLASLPNTGPTGQTFSLMGRDM